MQEILPLHYQQYLKWKNWKLVDFIDDVANVWVNSSKEFENIEIVLPLDTGLKDYKIRMAEVIETLHIAERRSYTSILADLKSLCTDKLRITLKNENIKFVNAAKVMDRSLDLLTENQYQEAIMAHSKGNKVVALGNIEKKHNKSEMTNIIKFSILE
jgi:hypothetical protein